MSCPRAAVCLAASWLILGAVAQAQTPATPPSAPPPEAQPAPQAQPAPPPQTQPAAPAGQNANPFGEEVTLPEKAIIFMNGNATWDSAFETLIVSIAGRRIFPEPEHSSQDAHRGLGSR